MHINCHGELNYVASLLAIAPVLWAWLVWKVGR